MSHKLAAVLLVLGVALGAAWADAETPYTGAAVCADCHADIAAMHTQHGHSHILTPVEAAQPAIPSPPEGYIWEDIAYIVGGWAWKANFLDHEGNLITGEAAQYNLPLRNERMNWDMIKAAWVPYRPDENVAYGEACAACHTTGYDAGAWAEDGVMCEACHGPGSAHAEAPEAVKMPVTRSSSLCRRCHFAGIEGSAIVDGVFIHPYAGVTDPAHTELSCVDCHDPHQSVMHEPVRTPCTDCHEDTPLSEMHTYAELACVECHMPPAAALGARAPEKLWTAMRTHLFVIQTDPEAPQFSESGAVMPYLTVAYACYRCHTDRSIEGLANSARAYHARRR